MHKDLYRARAAALSHDPDLDRRGQGRRPGAAGAQRQARRRRDPRADAERLGGRLQVRRQARDQRRTRSTARSSAPPNGSSRASSATPTSRNVSSDFNHDPHSSIFHMDQTKVMDGTLRAGHVLVRQRVGLLQPHGRHRRGDGQADLTGLRSSDHGRVPHARRRRRAGQARAAARRPQRADGERPRSPTQPASSASRRPSASSPARAAR